MIGELHEVREHLNADHADTIGLIACFVAADRVASNVVCTASICAVDTSGVDFAVVLDEHLDGVPFAVRHSFVADCTTIDEVRIELFGLLNAARAWAGDDLPLTSLECELSGSTYSTFVTEVADVSDITPTLRQITFRGGLGDFEPLGGDQFLYVLLPPRGRSELTVGTDFTWQGYEEMPDAERPTGAYYTVRAWRPAACEVDMWFVLHGDDGNSSSWAMRAEVGRPAALWGPRRAFEPPADTGSYLIVTDETGFGAVCAVLDELLAADPDVRATVVAESDGDAGHVEIPIGRNVEVSWLDRCGAEPGSTTLLIDAVRSLDVAQCVYAFGAAESRRITEVRKHLRDEVGLPAERVSMTGYWRAS